MSHDDIVLFVENPVCALLKGEYMYWNFNLILLKYLLFLMGGTNKFHLGSE